LRAISICYPGDLSMKIKNYDTSRFDFIKEVENIFNIQPGDLKNLHIARQDLLPTTDLNFYNETKTKFHKTFYAHLNSKQGNSIRGVYIEFIKKQIYPLFNRPILFQKFPSFRLHIPNSRAIHKWHYDSDEDHKHPRWEINFQIPLTEANNTSAMWIESVPGLRDYTPIEVCPGNFIIFDGNNLAHGNKVNKTGYTRVSFDFRILPYEKYDKNKIKKSVTANKSFQPGGYYEIYDKDEKGNE
jgi:hypothetical protein